MKEKLSVLLMIVLIGAMKSQCPSDKGIEINQKGASLIYTELHDALHGSVSNMKVVASATKHVINMRNDPNTINPDPSADVNLNSIQNLMFDLFMTTGSDKSIFMGYSTKRFLSYRVRPEKTFDYYDTSTGVLSSYKYDSTSGEVNTNNPLSSDSTFDVTSRPWFTEAIKTSHCPFDRNMHFSCSLGWTSAYKDYKVNQLVVTAFYGVPDYAGPIVLPETTGVLSQGQALSNGILGVIASDFFLLNLGDILTEVMSSLASSPVDIAYLMTIDGELLASSDNSLEYKCKLADCSDISSIHAYDSSNDLIASSATYIFDESMKSDNSVLWQDPSADFFTLTVKKLQTLGLNWLIVVLIKVDYHKSCSLVFQSVILDEAVHSLDILTSSAVTAGEVIKNSFPSVLGSVEPMKFENLNSNVAMSAQNVLKVVCEVYPDILSIFIGYQDSSFIQYKNTGGLALSSFTFQNSSQLMKATYYTNPLSGYAYTQFSAPKLATYDTTERPWYITAKEQSRSLFSPPYIFNDRNTIGITYSAPFYNSQGDLAGVVGVDISLANLAEQLQSFASVGMSIFATETEMSRSNADFNMLATSSQSKMTIKESNGLVRQSKAYAKTEVEDSYISGAAGYMTVHGITIDTSFGTTNLSCSILNYKKHGLAWRLVISKYGVEKEITTDESGYTDTAAHAYLSSPTMLGITVTTFVVLVIFSVSLGWIVHRQHRMLRLVSKRVKKVTRRHKAGRSQRIDMVNPLWGNTAAAGTQESSDEGTEIETQGKSAEVKEKTFVLKSVRDAHAPGEEP